MKKVVTKEERDVLDAIAECTGLNEWFCINEDGDGVLDLEVGHEMSIVDGLTRMSEEISEEMEADIEPEDFEEFLIMLKKFHIMRNAA